MLLGWRFVTPDENVPGDDVHPDPNHPGFSHLRDIYFDVDPEYTGRFTVPTLYDTKTKRIVSNEVRPLPLPSLFVNHPLIIIHKQSSEIIRMFYHEFDSLLPPQYAKINLLPDSLRAEIESSNDWIYNDINNGVYKSGFATTQEAYEKAVVTLFAALDKVEAHLSGKQYMYGDSITESDIRLYTTIVRFDAVYVQHFKTNLRDIRSGYPAIHKWLRHLYWDIPAFGETTQFEHIKKHYTKSHPQINPLGITPLGPVPDILRKDSEVTAVKH